MKLLNKPHPTVLFNTWLCNNVLMLCLITLLPLEIFGQKTQEQLVKEKKEIEAKIAYTGVLLDETVKNKKASLNQLTTLKRQISYRQGLIRTMNKEIKLMDRQIAENNDIIRALEKDLVSVKGEYAKMLYYGFKNRNSYDKLVFVFSSKDFNQAQKRLKYLQQYSEYRREQVGLIMSTKMLISDKNLALEEKKEIKRSLMAAKNTEKAELEHDKQDKNKVYTKLKGSESKLRADLESDKKEAKQLSTAIANIIAEEIRLAKLAAKNKKKFGLTPEESKLSTGFKSNRGKLPWPLKRAIITSTFGPHPHEFLREITVNNNGIDLSTNKGAKARAIFDGVVTAVIIMPNSNIKAVIVRHGEYFSVYGNLQEVLVSKGETITLKQELGVVFTDDDKFTTISHLEIWKMSGDETVKLDPQKWLAKKSDAD
jgi:septal ring factor EnvC (AmiA/AmiB activator)